MRMHALLVMALFVVAGFSLQACAPGVEGRLAKFDAGRTVNVVYIWDADGHTDLALLRGLKDEAARELAASGRVVSNNPNATGAYVKITVDDAVSGPDGYIKARLYVIDSTDQTVIYDKTCDAGSGGDGYPIKTFIGCALAEFTGGSAGE